MAIFQILNNLPLQVWRAMSVFFFIVAIGFSFAGSVKIYNIRKEEMKSNR